MTAPHKKGRVSLRSRRGDVEVGEYGEKKVKKGGNWPTHRVGRRFVDLREGEKERGEKSSLTDRKGESTRSRKRDRKNGERRTETPDWPKE